MIEQNFIQMFSSRGKMDTAFLSKGKQAKNVNADGFDLIFSQILNKDNVLEFDAADILGGQEQSFPGEEGILAFLKNLILGEGTPLERLFTDAEGLDDFKNILIEAGFDAPQVDAFFNDMAQQAGEESISLADLFAGLEEVDWSKKSEENVLSISMVPFLETVLTAVGMDSGEVTAVLSDAKTEGVGIDLNILLNNLKNFQKNAAAGSTVASNAGVSEEKVSLTDALKGLLEQLGLHQAASEGEEIGLNDVISGLEQLTGPAETPQVTLASESIHKELKQFLGKIKAIEKKSDDSLSFELSHESLKTELFNNINGKEHTRFPERLREDFTEGDMPLEDSLIPNSVLSDDEALIRLFEKDSKSQKVESWANRPVLPKGNEGDIALKKNDGERAFSLDNLIKEMGAPDTRETVAKENTGQRNLPTYVLNQVGRQIVRTVNNGENEIRFQIKPPHLGRLQMTIDNTPSGFKISIIAEQHATKDLILAHSSELKSMMAEQGLRIDFLDVDVSSDFQQAMSDANHQENGSRKRQSKQQEDMDDAGFSDIKDGSWHIEKMKQGENVLDLMA